LLLDKDKSGNIAWNRAVEEGCLEALETLWSWAKQVELNAYDLLLAKNEERETACQVTAEVKDEAILQKL
jgi:hypothetical protein